MIKGIGTDIVAIKRINKLLDRYHSRFTDRTFTKKEIEYCHRKINPAQHYAARFAAKEAFIKAMGKPFAFKDIEVKRPLEGPPEIALHNHANKSLNKEKILVSISHDHEYAIAQVIITD